MFIITISLGSGAVACSSNDDKVIPVGPDAQASLVIFFKSGVTEEQINAFSQEVLSMKDPQGRGYKLREGIGLQLRIFPPVQGHEGIAVTFFPDATQAQREELNAAIMSSPVVYKVLDNVAPTNVKKLD